MVNWLLHEEPLSPEDEIALSVLDHLLMGTPTSTLYKPMIESGLGTAIMGGGLSDELKQATFSIGLKGVKKEDVPSGGLAMPRSAGRRTASARTRSRRRSARSSSRCASSTRAASPRASLMLA